MYTNLSLLFSSIFLSGATIIIPNHKTFSLLVRYFFTFFYFIDGMFELSINTSYWGFGCKITGYTEQITTNTKHLVNNKAHNSNVCAATHISRGLGSYISYDRGCFATRDRPGSVDYIYICNRSYTLMNV